MTVPPWVVLGGKAVPYFVINLIQMASILAVSVYVLPLSIKPLRAWLRAQGITGVTIKKRGVRLDDEELRRQLRIGRGAGTGASTIVLLTRHAGRQVALALRAD